MQLTAEEQAWLDAYRKALAEDFPDLVEEIVIFGSKARGDAKPDSDLDVLLVIREGPRRFKDAVREPGYLLSIGTDVVPSMIVLTREEWSLLQKREAPFWQTVTRDGVVVR
jgi:predicted nucleotidyltransferase